MNKTDAITYFKTQKLLAEALGMNQSTISKSWGDYPPKLRQLQIEALTGGALKAEPGIIPRKMKTNRKGEK